MGTIGRQRGKRHLQRRIGAAWLPQSSITSGEHLCSTQWFFFCGSSRKFTLWLDVTSDRCTLATAENCLSGISKIITALPPLLACINHDRWGVAQPGLIDQDSLTTKGPKQKYTCSQRPGGCCSTWGPTTGRGTGNLKSSHTPKAQKKDALCSIQHNMEYAPCKMYHRCAIHLLRGGGNAQNGERCGARQHWDSTSRQINRVPAVAASRRWNSRRARTPSA